jgi:transcriptional regulator with XRE-family HTH domain
LPRIEGIHIRPRASLVQPLVPDIRLKTVAPRAGITLNMLLMIERGEGNPTWATIRGIAAALDVPVSELAKAAERLDG